MSSTKLVIMAGALLLLNACQRAAPDTSRISLEIPTYSKASESGILSCSPCLKEILINIDGDKFETIKFNQRDDIHAEGTQISTPEVTLDVPIGPQRRIQLLALYRNDTDAENSHISVHYGTVTVDLNSAEATVSVPLQKLGDVGGAIVGRYLTGSNPDRGPSGRVKIEFVHPSSGMAISLLHGEIIDGWFEFIAANSTNLRLTYKMADTGEVLFGGEPLSTDYIKNNKTSPSVLHISRPQTYYVNSGANQQVLRYAGDLVYGFFGNNPAVTTYTSRFACVEPTTSMAVSLDKTFRDTVGTYATYSASTDTTLNVSGDFKRTGGSFAFYDSPTASTVCSMPQYVTRVFEHNQIHFRKSQINGRGDSHARAIEGAFGYAFGEYSASEQSYIVKKFNRITPLEYAVSPLPGLVSSDESTRYNGARIFKKGLSAAAEVVGTNSEKKIFCNEDWLSANNFTEVTGGDFTESPSLNTSGDLTFAFDVIPNSDTVVVCPSKTTSPSPDKVMDGLGALNMGDLRFAELEVFAATGATPTVSGDTTILNYGMATIGSSNDATVTLKNNGNVAISIAGNSVPASSDFTFGSNNVYPGTGNAGACGATLAANDTCDVVLRFTPQASGARSVYYDLQYSVSSQSGSKILKFKLMGTGN